jgi:hypothetical protein
MNSSQVFVINCSAGFGKYLHQLPLKPVKRFFMILSIIRTSELLLSSARKRKMERSAITHFTFDPNATTMSMHSESAKRQTNAQATSFAFATQARKLIEDTLLIGGWDAGSVILNPDMQPTILNFGTYFQFTFSGCELAGVFH